MLAMGLALFACSLDNVAPTDGNPSLSGSAGDIHFDLDSICTTDDRLYLCSPSGSRNVNKCFGQEVEITCPENQPYGG